MPHRNDDWFILSTVYPRFVKKLRMRRYSSLALADLLEAEQVPAESYHNPKKPDVGWAEMWGRASLQTSIPAQNQIFCPSVLYGSNSMSGMEGMNQERK